MSVNKVILVGRLGRDPESRSTRSGKDVCNFSMATGRDDKTEWHNVVVWDQQAQHCQQYLSKGSQVYVEGRMQTRHYEANDGSKRYVTEVVAFTVQFLDGKRDDTQRSADRPEPRNGKTVRGANELAEGRHDVPDDPSDDIPF